MIYFILGIIIGILIPIHIYYEIGSAEKKDDFAGELPSRKKEQSDKIFTFFRGNLITKKKAEFIKPISLEEESENDIIRENKEKGQPTKMSDL